MPSALCGPALALRYALRRLRVPGYPRSGWIERRLSTLLHLSARGYRSPFPPLALDVDKATDLPLVEEVLGVRYQVLGPNEPVPAPNT